MSSIPSEPKTPAEWLKYAQSEVVTSIPLRQERNTNSIIERDIYLDESRIVKPPSQLWYAYTDVFAFTQPEVTISPEAYGSMQIIARVLTADKPTHLKIIPDTICWIHIYASILDQPLSVSVGDQEPLLLELGQATGNVGVKLIVFPDHIDIEYQDVYMRAVDEDLQSSLETQLRIALVLFWRNPSIATSICSYVASVTSDLALNFYAQINTQAVALGQQLVAQAMMGQDISPALKIDQYMSTVRDALDAVTTFEEQYQRFHDNKCNVDSLKLAWEALLQHAQTQLNKDITLRKVAWDKYQDACTVVARCQEQFNADNRQLGDAEAIFQSGLTTWYMKTGLITVFETLSAIIKFSSALPIPSLGSESCIGDAAKNINSAIDDMIQLERRPDQTGKIIPSPTLKTLGDCIQVLERMYPSTIHLAAAIKELESNPNAKISSYGEVTETRDEDTHARTIITLSAWDKWTLDSDQQLEYAVNQNILGAPAYRLALRKQAVNGKALVQAQLEAVRAGHEYVYAAMEVITCNQDITSLENLLGQYNNDKEQYYQAEAKFFSRVLAARTSLVMQMRKLVWAYKYRSLADSSAVLDSQKSIAEFKADLLTLDCEVRSVDEKYATYFQPFEYRTSSSELPANYGDLMIQGLQGESHSAGFTLAPAIDPADKNHFASVFNDGSHFRLEGLEIFLQGVVPRAEAIHNGVAHVDIDILTSGVYADIQGGKMYHFTGPAIQVRFSYEITESGEIGHTVVCARFPAEEHAEPTPFTQWTVKLQNPDDLDLTKLSGVELHWRGKATFVEIKVSS
ncbi:hypothetical protein ANOM_001074 [Aspergillus nomiae NRRL 13137]|uniref:Uncharacterized protein n=1 Tax=Aspergillus nomiae NRRL (strain ATCC 15546 / NRRL 13137 / CBS 260.88 / M93) TaxID=1509407 RepID=A0A0L1JFZ8_ASPN3|nr:uncharacterized protein ANOM_001074 [Aspergillus nomiae NRRL 13137]KNG90700.1 hypothetical protein ANOM_001074 [Aspergillus nomiae NRRL 13137]